MRQLFNTKLKIIIIVAVLLTAALSVMAGLTNHSIPELLVQGILAPFRAAGTSLTKTAERYYSYMFRYEALEAENEALKKQVAELQDTARKADATERENTRLRNTMKLLESHDTYEEVDAYIIGWSSTDWSNTLTINRGTSAGITENMVAITDNGEVVGLVSQVGPNFAVVKTVLDSTLEISATITTSGYNGMVSGGYIEGNEKYLQMDYLPSSSIIRNKDQVVTSGSTVYPRGLVLGKVVDAGFKETGVAKYAVLKPAADISSLEQIFIVTNFRTETETITVQTDGGSADAQ